MSTVINTSPMTQYHPEGRNHSNQIAAAADWLGHKLTYTISLSLMDFPKIFRPINLGIHGQCRQMHYEIGMRILRAARIVVLLPINLTIGIVGVALRALATCARADMTFVRPNSPVELPEVCNHLRVRTFNVAMTSNFVTVPNGVRDVETRIREVSSAVVKSLDEGDDIICIQEMFHTEVVERLVRSLKRNFPEIHIIYNVGHQRTGLNSGLMIISKKPLERPCFWRHPRTEGYSNWANLGHIIVTVVLSKTQKLVMSNTHLNTDGDNHGDDYTGRTCRREQFLALEKNFRSYIDLERKGISNDKALVGFLQVGDYNMDLQQELLKVPELTEKYSHNFAPDQQGIWTVFDTRKYPTCWDTERLKSWTGSQHEQVDYILVPKEWKNVRSTVYIDDMQGGSDHRAVCAVIEFTTNPG